MTIYEAMKKFRLPNPTTPEDLACRWSTCLDYGDKVFVAGHYWQGTGEPDLYAAIYEHLDDDLSCEGTIALREVSDVLFYDAGHAVEWCLMQK